MSNSVFIIAELSANHNGKLSVAIDTIKQAAKCGADAIKIQTYTADTITLNCDRDDFVIKGGTIWDGRKLYDLYLEAFTPWEWHAEIFRVAKEEMCIRDRHIYIPPRWYLPLHSSLLILSLTG